MIRAARLAAACLLVAAAASLPPAAEPISRLQTQWWRARHEEKLREIAHGPIDLVMLGDSITQNYEHAGAQGWDDFRPVWQRFYGVRHAVNLGFKGDATSHLLWRIEHGEVAGIAPKVAVVLIGANNLGRLHWSAPDTVLGIETVVAELHRRLPRTRILLLGVLPSIRSPWATQTTASINAALAEHFGQGRVSFVTYLDVSSVFLRDGKPDPEKFLDPRLVPPEPPLHPTAQAQADMAAAIEPTLQRLLTPAE
jgi:lysophospholipase L1-like esterase